MDRKSVMNWLSRVKIYKLKKGTLERRKERLEESLKKELAQIRNLKPKDVPDPYTPKSGATHSINRPTEDKALNATKLSDYYQSQLDSVEENIIELEEKINDTMWRVDKVFEDRDNADDIQAHSVLCQVYFDCMSIKEISKENNFCERATQNQKDRAIDILVQYLPEGLVI